MTGSRDALGWRAKFGVLGPSTNTIVQPEFDDLRVPGVTNHYSRIVIRNASAVSDETFMAGTQGVCVDASFFHDQVDELVLHDDGLDDCPAIDMFADAFIGKAQGSQDCQNDGLGLH